MSDLGDLRRARIRKNRKYRIVKDNTVSYLRYKAQYKQKILLIFHKWVFVNNCMNDKIHSDDIKSLQAKLDEIIQSHISNYEYELNYYKRKKEKKAQIRKQGKLTVIGTYSGPLTKNQKRVKKLEKIIR